MQHMSDDFDPARLDEELGWHERGSPDLASIGETNHLREFAVERIDEVMKRAFRIVRFSRNKVAALDFMALSLGWHGEIGGITKATELGHKHKCTKANVTKFVKQFQDVLPTGLSGIQPLPGQRKDETRKTFSDNRKEQCR